LSLAKFILEEIKVSKIEIFLAYASTIAAIISAITSIIAVAKVSSLTKLILDKKTRNVSGHISVKNSGQNSGSIIGANTGEFYEENK